MKGVRILNILFIASSSDWHVDLWVKYFTRDHSVFLFTDKEDYLKDQAFANVNILHSSGYLGGILNFFKSNSHRLFQVNKLLSAKFFAKKIDEYIEKHEIDIVHAHSLYYGYVASFIRSGAPVVFTPMGSDVILHAQSDFIYRYMAQKSFAKARVVTGDSVVLQRKGLNVGAKKDHNFIVQNGVDSSIFFPMSNNIREEYGVENSERLIFSPRAITPIYNIDTIIDSLAFLKGQGYKFKCMFSFAFGDDYSDSLKATTVSLGLEKNVIWLGFLSYQDMAKYYNAADVVVSVPSSDSSPKSVYEALFCGKPIVVSDLEWSYELLGDAECLLRVDARNSQQLGMAIKSVLDDDTLAKRLSDNALAIAYKEFDYEKNMKQMETIMREAVEDCRQ